MTGNYVASILAALAVEPDTVVCVRPDGTEVRRGELAALVHRMARGLAAHGVGPGSTVTTLSANRVEMLAARYAVSLLGARVVNLYEGIAPSVQTAIVSDVDTDVLLVDPDLAVRAKELGEHPAMELTFDDLLASGADATPVAPHPVGEEDVFCIRHTGGTTGHPKGIPWSFRTHAGIVEFMSTYISPDTVQLVCTTLAHIAGQSADAIILAGGRLVLLSRFDAGKVLEAIERYRATDLIVLPPLLYALMDHPAIDEHDLSSLRQINYGGCPASPERIKTAMQRFGPVLAQAYGTNEAGGIALLSPEEHQRPELLETAGRPLPGIEVAIRDERDRDLPAGERGEVCVKSASSATHYWRNPELTAQVFRDGWVHTGDVGFLDEEGYLHLSGRIKDMIIVVGGHAYPGELEEVLLGHPAVAQVAVYGVSDEDRMERIHVAVSPAPGRTLTIEEVREFVTERLGAMYAPHALHLVDEIPLTDVGKPDLKLLRAAAG
ncbi:class I adenylate-forming enzyme family protein [Amycolatopsis sp. NPDC059021]|uniref:class I adenylate-forming enzyme family protein n=1 Tax=Amycolatopsis sp. NPDC059021 TaxID=3346704 RepID=UPI0036727DEC